jgi:methyl coenzyme M reductase beta subunit
VAYDFSPRSKCKSRSGELHSADDAPAEEDGKMKRTLYIASGVSVLITSLVYGHGMYQTIAHLVTHHGQSFTHPFFAAHMILAAATGVLSLIGAYFLLTGWRQHNPN